MSLCLLVSLDWLLYNKFSNLEVQVLQLCWGFFKIVLTIMHPLHYNMNFRTDFLISSEESIGISI